jgi:hypothetical protein
MAGYIPVIAKEINLTADQISTDATFDAVLSRPVSGMSMYKLTLKLRIRLQQAYPSSVINDFNDTPFSLRPWTAPEWQTFVNGAKAQANLWNNQFWLKPPPSVTDYDFTVWGSDRRFRPYIACELDVDFNADKADAHQVIEVYNLDLSQIPGTKDSGTFRSDSLHYDSLDTVPWVTTYRDKNGAQVMHYTIAHEIGHSIGQPHIGVMRKTPLCKLAMHFGGDDGQNWDACYGGDQPSLGMNVMGGGGTFTDDNAISWVWAMLWLRNNSPEYWQVLTTRPAAEGEWQLTDKAA